MKKLFIVITSIVILSSLCGCLALFVGAGIAGGRAIGEDTIELIKEADYSHAWNISIETIKRMGTIDNIVKEENKIEATIKGTYVMTTIEKVTPNVVKINVKARKNMAPNIGIAGEVINNLNNML